MTRVNFVKWYPFTKEIPGFPDFKWDVVREYEHDEGWLRDVNFLVTMGFYVGIHWNPDNSLITIMVDTTWFRQR